MTESEIVRTENNMSKGIKALLDSSVRSFCSDRENFKAFYRDDEAATHDAMILADVRSTLIAERIAGGSGPKTMQTVSSIPID